MRPDTESSSSDTRTASTMSSSPVRRSPARNAVRTPGSADRSGRRNRRDTLKDILQDSPTRQLTIDFHRILLRSDQDFNKRLDSAASETAKMHAEQLRLAEVAHEKIRAAAERERQHLIEKETKRLELLAMEREIERQREIARLEREKAEKAEEQRQRALEALRVSQEEDRRAAEHRQKIEEQKARARAEQEQAAATERQRAQLQQQQQQAEQRAKQAATTQPAPPVRATPTVVPTTAQPVTTAQPSAPSQQPASSAGSKFITDAQVVHKKFLELHQRMKDFHKPFAKHHRTSPLKSIVGDSRRDLRTRMGQITIERDAAKEAIARLRATLNSLRSHPEGPMIDIRPFIVSYPIPQLADEAEAQFPALLLYGLILFEKFLLKQFVVEAPKEDGRTIAQLGLVAASVFSKDYMWKDIPLFDLVLAKLHKVCPLLFGISRRPDIEVTSEKESAMAAGFASVALLDFPKPVLPIVEYWHAVTFICNTKPAELTSTHFTVLAALLRNYAAKFLMYYGKHAQAVLKRATIDLPKHAPAEAKTSASIVSVLPDVWSVQNPPIRL